MSDRELLEMAAKAAGYSIHPKGRTDGNFVVLENEDGALIWNPLTDDGDSRRLQVQLGIDVTLCGNHAAVASYISGPCIQVYSDGDLCAATRLAVLRAAAEIGKAMP